MQGENAIAVLVGNRGADAQIKSSGESKRNRLKSMYEHFMTGREPLIAAVLIMFCLLCMPLLNHVLLAEPSPSQIASQNPAMNRAIASVESVSPNFGAQQSQNDRQAVEARVLSYLKSNANNVQVLAVGNSPSRMQQLLYGTLEGCYTAEIQSGHLQSLQYIGLNKSKADACKAESAQHLLRHQRELESAFGLPFAKAVPVATRSANGQIIKTFELIDSQRHTLASAQMTLDGHGGIMSMQVQKE